MLTLKGVCKTFNAGTINEKRALVDIDLHLARMARRLAPFEYLGLFAIVESLLPKASGGLRASR